jgi:membrane AbrB-like protein
MRRIIPLALLGALTAAAGWALSQIGLPSSYLFAALMLGIAAALLRPGRAEVPGASFEAAQAVTGVTLGAYVQSSSLSALGDAWLPVALVSAATLAFSIGGGVVLSRFTSLDRATGTLGMVAGGASGIVAMADELGADDRLVAFMQYLRVLVVVVLTPVLIAVAFSGHDAVPVPGDHEPLLGDARGWLLVLGIAAVGAFAGRAARLPAATLLGPMLLGAGIALALGEGELVVPPLLRETAFALIGLQVGLRFTLQTVREVGRLLAPVLACLLALLGLSFLLAIALDATTSVTLLDAYLATTPGGLYAVLAVSVGAGANTTFILAVQTLRLLVMVLLAPFVVRWVAGPGRRAPLAKR